MSQGRRGGIGPRKAVSLTKIEVPQRHLRRLGRLGQTGRGRLHLRPRPSANSSSPSPQPSSLSEDGTWLPTPPAKPATPSAPSRAPSSSAPSPSPPSTSCLTPPISTRSEERRV